MRAAAVLLLLLLLFVPRLASGHEGPPFPIVVDHRIGEMFVSVWSDPDIGTGTFFIVIEPVNEGTLPADIVVDVGVAPVSGRLEEVRYRAEPQDVRYGARHYTEVQFDQGEMWTVHVYVSSEGAEGTIVTEVEATPDGTIGPLGLIVYLLPFLAVGFLWLKAAMRKRRAA